MNEITDVRRLPRRVRMLHALGKDPDWSTVTPGDLTAFQIAQNRKRSSRLARVVTGRPARGVAIRWQHVARPDREIPVRVYRPAQPQRRGGADPVPLPLVLHVHGGGFVGTAAQSDWVNSHLAAQLPAVVVSVEHRLLDDDTPLTSAIEDGWDVLEHVEQHPAEWGVNPHRVAVFGESAGALITALAAIRARDSGLDIRAQVLVNPCVDVTATLNDYASMSQFADSPTLTMEQMEMFLRLGVPPGTDARPLSPLYAENSSRLAPALVVVPTYDALADQGRRYAERLRAAGTSVSMSEYHGAIHAFLSMPGLVPQAKPARAEIVEFLRDHLGG